MNKPGRLNKEVLIREAKEWAQSLLVALLLTLVIRATVVQAFKIPSGSMIPTLEIGDKLFVDKLSYRFHKPERGDIVVFEYPFPAPIDFLGQNIVVRSGQITMDGRELTKPAWVKKIYYETVFYFLGKKDFIKRLVAFEGESVEIRDGKIYVNGKVLNDPKTFGKRDSAGRPAFYYFNHSPYANPNEKVKVPSDSYFVLGDNSGNSQDSRFWGFVPKKNMIGKAVVRWWPLNRIGRLQ